MKTFVTGATGVLGKAVIPKLLADGHAVGALSRSEANRKVLLSLGAKLVQAELFDEESLKQALAGCEAILHLAIRIAPTSKMAKRAAWSRPPSLWVGYKPSSIQATPSSTPTAATGGSMPARPRQWGADAYGSHLPCSCGR